MITQSAELVQLLTAVIRANTHTATLNHGGLAGWTLNIEPGIYAVFADAPEQYDADNSPAVQKLPCGQLHIRRLAEPLNIPSTLFTADLWNAIQEAYWSALERIQVGVRLRGQLVSWLVDNAVRQGAYVRKHHTNPALVVVKAVVNSGGAAAVETLSVQLGTSIERTETRIMTFVRRADVWTALLPE